MSLTSDPSPIRMLDASATMTAPFLGEACLPSDLGLRQNVVLPAITSSTVAPERDPFRKGKLPSTVGNDPG